MVDKANVAKVVLSLIAITVSAGLIGARFFPDGCGPDEDQLQLLAQLNNLPEIQEKGGHVREIVLGSLEERDAPKDVAARPEDNDNDNDNDDDVYRFEAEIFDSTNQAIGRLRGGRITGFGTMSPRIHWYETPGVREEMPRGGDRRGRGDRGRDRGSEQERRQEFQQRLQDQGYQGGSN